MNYILFTILCLIWGTTWSAIKIGLEGTPPLVGMALRFLIAAVILFLIILISGRPVQRDRNSIKLYLFVGLLNMSVSYFCTYWGMQFIPSSLSSILWTTMPLVTGILAHYLVRGEHLNKIRISAIILSMAGVFVILSDQTLVFNTQVLLGCLITLSGVFFAAFPSIYVKNWKAPYDPMVLTAFALGTAGLFHGLNALICGHWAQMQWTLKNILSAAYLGIFGSAVVFSIYFYLIRHISVVKLSFVTFITPLFALLVGAGILGELVTLREIMGMMLIFVGLFIYDWRKYLRFFGNLNYRRVRHGQKK